MRFFCSSLISGWDLTSGFQGENRQLLEWELGRQRRRSWEGRGEIHDLVDPQSRLESSRDHGSRPVPTIRLGQAGRKFDQLPLSTRLLAKSRKNYPAKIELN